jgi:hypothetical protein
LISLPCRLESSARANFRTSSLVDMALGGFLDCEGFGWG